MMIVDQEYDETVAVAVAFVGAAVDTVADTVAALVVFEIDTLYVVVQTDIAQLEQVQMIEVVNEDLYAYFN